MMAAKKGLVGLSFTNTSPLVVPTRAREAALGTNPIALAVPTTTESPWVLDMATSTVPIGKIEVFHRKQDKVPLGWGVDKEGTATVQSHLFSSFISYLIHSTCVDGSCSDLEWRRSIASGRG